MARRRRVGLSSSGGAGGGGGGGGVPTPPAAGLVLTSTGSGAGDFDWEPPGGDVILTFSGISATRELGNAAASFSFTCTTNVAPVSASVSWSGVGTGGPQVVAPSTSMSGTITGPFNSTGATAGQQLIVTITCVFTTGTKTATQVVTWDPAVVWGNSAAPTTVTIATLRAIDVALKGSNAGTYGATMGAGEYMTWSAPAAFVQPPTVLFGVLPIVPVQVQTAVAYVNPYGVSVSMNVWTFGVSGIGAASFSVTS